MLSALRGRTSAVLLAVLTSLLSVVDIASKALADVLQTVPESRAWALTFGNQIGAVMVAVTKPATQVVWPVANHARKSDKSLASALSDDEAAGDVADAEDATFGKRFAALEQK